MIVQAAVTLVALGLALLVVWLSHKFAVRVQ